MPALSSDIEQKVFKARFQLFEYFPFFGQLAQYFKIVEVPGHGTASINANGELKLDPDFVRQCNEKDMLFVLCHEAMHIVDETSSRFPEGGDPDTWNMAADAVINPILVDDSGLALIRPEVIQPVYGGRFKKYAGSTHEAVYYDMMQNPEKAFGQSMAEFKKACEQAGDTNPQKGRGKGSMKGIWWDNSPSELAKKGQDKGLDDAGNPKSDGGMTEAQRSEWRDRICSAAEAQKAIGNMPGSLEGYITKLLKPKKNWKKELRVAVRSTIQDQWSFKKPSRRTTALNIRTPGVFGEKPECICALDTSGSMRQPELQRALSEIKSIFDLVGGKTHLILCDAEVYFAGELESKSLEKMRDMQHGGTDLTKIFDWINEPGNLKKQPSMLVVFSDMETPFPTHAPKYPVIWCNPGGNGKAPWGKNIRVELD